MIPFFNAKTSSHLLFLLRFVKICFTTASQYFGAMMNLKPNEKSEGV
jgi:hypothetical protein